eukprot:scaffold3077_cov162-Amphora_coffeaeformis.AAC.13
MNVSLRGGELYHSSECERRARCTTHSSRIAVRGWKATNHYHSAPSMVRGMVNGRKGPPPVPEKELYYCLYRGTQVRTFVGYYHPMAETELGFNSFFENMHHSVFVLLG